MEINIGVCGPIRESKLVLPERGIVAIVGPNLSGKSLLEETLSSAAVAMALTSDGSVIGRLAERMLNNEGWYKAYSGDHVDPLEYLTMEMEYRDEEDYLSKLNKLSHEKGKFLGIKDYLMRTLFASDLCLSRDLQPWGDELAGRLRIEMEFDSGYIRASLPGKDPKRIGSSAIIDSVTLSLPSQPWGINVSSPNEFLRGYVTGEGALRPSILFAKVVTNSLRYEVEPSVLKELTGLLLISWKEISRFEVSEEEFYIVERRGEPCIGIGEAIYPWRISSEGVVNILAHWILARVLPLFKQEKKGALVGLEEPESHLDPYAAYLLPKFYAELVKKYDTVLVLSTHSEMFVKGLEDLVAEKILKPEQIKVYETYGEGGSFKLKQCTISEDGYIKDSRFTEIARRLLEVRLKGGR
ncbi:MAG: hypothetical protein QXV05_04130 [Candidatus Korarchaeum sp.]